MAVGRRRRLLHRDIKEEIRVYENLVSCMNDQVLGVLPYGILWSCFQVSKCSF